MGQNQLTGKIEEGFGGALSVAGQNADYIVIGDTNHTKLTVRNAASSAEMVDGLAQAGVSVIALEFPQQLDYIAQEYLNSDGSPEAANRFDQQMNDNFFTMNEGEVSKQDMIASVRATIDHARTYQMDVRFVDPGNGADALTEPFALAESAMEWYAEDTGTVPDYNDQSYVASAVAHSIEQGYFSPEEETTITDFALAADPVLRATEWYSEQTGTELEITQTYISQAHVYAMENGFYSDEERQAISDYGQKFIDQRFDDSQLAQNIVDASGGQKTAVIYGSWHDDLPERLPGEVLVADIYENREAFESTDPQESPGFKVAGSPDFVYLAEEGEMYVTDAAEPSLTNGLTETPVQDPVQAPALPNFLENTPQDPSLTAPRSP